MIVKLTFGTLIGEKYKHTAHSKKTTRTTIFGLCDILANLKSNPLRWLSKSNTSITNGPASIISFFSPPSLFYYSSFQSEWLLFYFLSIVKWRSFLCMFLCKFYVYYVHMCEYFYVYMEYLMILLCKYRGISRLIP